MRAGLRMSVHKHWKLSLPGSTCGSLPGNTYLVNDITIFENLFELQENFVRVPKLGRGQNLE